MSTGGGGISDTAPEGPIKPTAPEEPTEPAAAEAAAEPAVAEEPVEPAAAESPAEPAAAEEPAEPAPAEPPAKPVAAEDPTTPLAAVRLTELPAAAAAAEAAAGAGPVEPAAATSKPAAAPPRVKRKRSRRARIISWTAIGVSIALVASVIAVVVAVGLQLSGITHIKRIDTTGQPPKYTNALNVLLLGSDTRSGHNARIGGKGGCNCSDTIMIAHLSPGRQSATVVSIPRDTVVPYYKCAPWRGLPGQQADPSAYERINATLAAGGPECVRETVEQQTGIYIDYVIQLNFVGFQRAITDIGGVNVCLPFAINNKVSKLGGVGSNLDLSAGWHHINGRVALEYWRTRYDVADGSDLARIARDQYLMAQIVKGVLRSGLLHSPTKLYSVIGDLANEMTTDASNTQLLHIALSLHGISPKNIQFITAPWASYPYNPNEVEFAQPQANAVFWALAHDTALPPSASRSGRHGGTAGRGGHTSTPPVGTASTASPTASPSASASQPPTVNPSLVHVMILNGSSGPNRTSLAATELTSRGFTVLGTGYASATTYRKTVVEYSSAADLPAAMTLKAQFFPVTIKRVAGLAPGTVEVILGSTFTMLAAPGPTSQSSLHSLHNNYGGITANVRCRNSAFYGTAQSVSSGHANSCVCG